jgi:cbb3-type cytochrome oxidase maturation protein
MSVIVLLIAAGGAVAIGFLAAFVWAVRSGQFDDVVSPAWRVLFEDAPVAPVRSVGELEWTRPVGRSESVEDSDSGEPLHVRHH